MNRSRRPTRQRGFLLVGLILALGIVATLLVAYVQYDTRRQVKDNVNSFYHRVLYYKEKFHAYASDHYQAGWGINTASIFPTQFSDLEGEYIPTCSVTDNQKGFCQRYNQTPWGEIADSDYRVIAMPNDTNPSYYRAELDIHLPDKTIEAYQYERRATLQLFSQMPNIVYEDTNNLITLRIDRPDKAFAYDSLVKRSGDDSELLGDWDTGGSYAITNAYDYSIKGQDTSGNTRQISVVRGLDRKMYVHHGDHVSKPVCPDYTTPSLWLSIARTNIDSSYTATGSMVPEYEDKGEYWQIRVQQRVKNNATGVSSINYNATVLAQTSCE